jgi:hypothetical protein
VDELDARTDIFAFGAVVYEMVTGKKAFEGKSAASVAAKILEHDPPPMSSLQPVTPPALDHVVKKCLAKEPDDRWQTARDVWHELRWIAEGGGQVLSGVEGPAPLSARRKLRKRLAWGIAAIVILLFGVLAAVHFREAPPESAPISFSISAPENSVFFSSTSAVVSPDGSQVAFLAIAGGRQQIWIRTLGSLTARPLPGTEGAVNPFWSPDSQYVGFFLGGKLYKIAIAGGPPQPLCDTAGGGTGRTGTWNRDGTIVFVPRTDFPLHRVSSAGGQPTPVTILDQSTRDRPCLSPLFTRRAPFSLPSPQLKTGKRRCICWVVRLPRDEVSFASGFGGYIFPAWLFVIFARRDPDRSGI